MPIYSKFLLEKIETTEYTSYSSKRLIFTTQYDSTIPEDQRFCKATPNGRIEMVVDNPAALAYFKVGAYYYFAATEIVIPAIA